MPGGLTGTVPMLLNWLEHDAPNITRNSYKAGEELGKKLAYWKRYNRETLIKVAQSVKYMGANKDRPAYQVGLMAGYIAVAFERGHFTDADALAMSEIESLGVRQKTTK